MSAEFIILLYKMFATAEAPNVSAVDVCVFFLKTSKLYLKVAGLLVNLVSEFVRKKNF